MKSDCLTLKSLMFAALLALAACGTEDEPVPDTGTDTGADSGDAGVDPDTAGDACTSDSCGVTCDEPDPSVTCQETGCAMDRVCAPVDGCVPSSCFCDEESGAWGCTEDCNQNYACVEPETECPATEPDPSGTCTEQQEGLSCSWGEECCCGECFPSFGCDCNDGEWQCFATDACFIESCEGRACETDTDCEGGAGGLACLDGVCAMPPATALDCANLNGQTTCDERTGCEWIEPPGCTPEPGAPALEAAGCFAEARCESDADCGVAEYCSTLTVAPRCYWDEPLCDACLDERSLCLPRAR